MLLASLFAAVLLQAAPAAMPDADPLAPASAGQMQCYMPDAARKTCRSLSGYAANGDGTYSNTAVILLSASPVITMTSASQVRVANGAVCGAIRTQDITSSLIMVNGQALTPDQAQPILTTVTNALKDMIDRDICTTYETAGDGMMSHSIIDGVAHPELDQPVIWVSPSDNYKVAP